MNRAVGIYPHELSHHLESFQQNENWKRVKQISNAIDRSSLQQFSKWDSMHAVYYLSYIISTYTLRRIAYFVGAILCCVKWLDSSFIRFFLEFEPSSYSKTLVMRKAVNKLRSK